MPYLGRVMNTFGRCERPQHSQQQVTEHGKKSALHEPSIDYFPTLTKEMAVLDSA